MKNFPRIAAAIAMSLSFIVLPSRAASAHAVLDHSFPTDGSRISVSPVQVRLYFTEGVRLQFSSFRLADLQGNVYRVRAEAVPNDQAQVILGLPHLGDGVYVVSWQILSADDSHLTDGRILFGVNQDVTTAASKAGAPTERLSGLEVSLRWLDVLFAAVVIGGLSLAASILRRRTGIRRRVLLASAFGCAGSLAAGIALFAWEVTRIRGSMPPGSTWLTLAGQLLTQGRWAWLWWVRQSVLLGLLGLTIAIIVTSDRANNDGIDRSERALIWGIVGAPVLVLAMTRALGSHAASADYSAWAVAVDTVHVLAAGVWIGGLITLSFGTWPALRRGGVIGTGEAIAAWRRFGILAVTSFGVLVATGLFEAARQVASVDGLLFTPYGKALLAKTGLALALAGFGAANALLLHPGIRAGLKQKLGIPASRVAAPRLPRWAIIEAVVAALVLAMVAIMTSASPPRGPAFLPGGPPPLASATGQAQDLVVSLSITPNRPGTNLISAKTASTVRPAPPEVESASLTVSSQGGAQSAPIPMRLVEAGQFQVGGDQLDRPGSWQIRFTAVRPGLPDVVVSFDLVVGSGTRDRTPIVSVAPIGRMLTVGAVVVLILLMIGLCTALLGPTRRAFGQGGTTRPSEDRSGSEPVQEESDEPSVPVGVHSKSEDP